MTDKAIEDLKVRVNKLESLRNALVATAVIFGLGGGFGWKALSESQGKLAALETQVTNAQQHMDASAKSALDREISENGLGKRVVVIEAHLQQVGSGETPVPSNRDGSIRSTLTASCPTGTVVRGVNVNRGGTCNNKCDGDGAPVSQIELICVRQ